MSRRTFQVSDKSENEASVPKKSRRTVLQAFIPSAFMNDDTSDDDDAEDVQEKAVNALSSAFAYSPSPVPESSRPSTPDEDETDMGEPSELPQKPTILRTFARKFSLFRSTSPNPMGGGKLGFRGSILGRSLSPAPPENNGLKNEKKLQAPPNIKIIPASPGSAGMPELETVPDEEMGMPNENGRRQSIFCQLQEKMSNMRRFSISPFVAKETIQRSDSVRSTSSIKSIRTLKEVKQEMNAQND